ncbi:MAG TPA: hypothetical protein VGK17_03085 [Propionicimonas sp.]|jgi:hypothetical protein
MNEYDTDSLRRLQASQLNRIADAVEDLVNTLKAQAPVSVSLDTTQPVGWVVIDKDDEIRSGVYGPLSAGEDNLRSYLGRVDEQWAPYRLGAVYELGAVILSAEVGEVDHA